MPRTFPFSCWCGQGMSWNDPYTPSYGFPVSGIPKRFIPFHIPSLSQQVLASQHTSPCLPASVPRQGIDFDVPIGLANLVSHRRSRPRVFLCGNESLFEGTNGFCRSSEVSKRTINQKTFVFGGRGGGWVSISIGPFFVILEKGVLRKLSPRTILPDLLFQGAGRRCSSRALTRRETASRCGPEPQRGAFRSRARVRFFFLPRLWGEETVFALLLCLVRWVGFDSLGWGCSLRFRPDLLSSKPVVGKERPFVNARCPGVRCKGGQGAPAVLSVLFFFGGTFGHFLRSCLVTFK